MTVDKNAIKKLFRSAALKRPREDPCKELTLYEFCLFSKSDKAEKDFENLMEDIKYKTVGQRKAGRQVSSTGLLLAKTGPAKILPVRDKVYVRNLPSSFNALMNHFKDEETRNEMRKEIVGGLLSIENRQNPTSAQQVVGENVQSLRKLVESHFPEEGIDDQYRKLLTMNKNSSDIHKLMQNQIKEHVNVAIKPRQSLKPGATFNLGATAGGTHRKFTVNIEDLEFTKTMDIPPSMLNRKLEEINEVVEHARIEGRKEARELLREGSMSNHKKIPELARQKTFTSRILSNDALSTGSIETIQEMKRSRCYNKEMKLCLEENLILRKTPTDNDATLKSTMTNGGLPMSKTESLPAFKVNTKYPTQQPHKHQLSMKASIMSLLASDADTKSDELNHYTQYKVKKGLQSPTSVCPSIFSSYKRVLHPLEHKPSSGNIYEKYKKCTNNNGLL